MRSPLESRQPDFISQFASDIQHISGANNLVEDTLFRIISLDSLQGITLLKHTHIQKVNTSPARVILGNQDTTTRRYVSKHR